MHPPRVIHKEILGILFIFSERDRLKKNIFHCVDNTTNAQV